MEALNGVNLDLFYSVRFGHYDTHLQGKCQKEIIRYCEENFDASFIYCKQGWLIADVMIKDIKVMITLTID
jgi:hypothetical protein